jgi:hypothetical protein
MRTAKRFLALALLTLAADAAAAPIRVGMFNGTGQGRYWHTSIHTAGTVIASILANPDSAGLGAGLFRDSSGFTFSRYGIAINGTMQTPSAAQTAAFISALDSLDVVIVSNFVDIGGSIVDTAQRARFARFIRTQGLVSLHQSTDSYGRWPVWDSLHGTRFQNHPQSDRNGTLHFDSAAMTDSAWRFLNRGLPDTTRFLEEWLSFTTNGDVIRAVPGLKVTVKLDEAGLAGGTGGMRAMGDHPYSWYREFPEGGRIFYTGVGHRATLYTGTNTNYLQRQLYNAIMWAAGYNEDGSRTVGMRTSALTEKFPGVARISNHGGTFTVSILQDGPNTVEVRTLAGRLVASRHGTGRSEHRFADLPSNSMLVVTVKMNAGRAAKLVPAP